ncbi:MAG: tetratricopeptide repeat protein [Pseudohongiellaceae bacterium]
MLKKYTFLTLSLLLLAVASTARADYEDGLDAALGGDYRTALREFTVAAEGGLDLAQFNLAILYFTGRGVDRDLTQAFHWTEMAAQQGHVEAQANLGSLYLTGDGVTRDVDAGVRWLGSAAKAGHAPAAFSLADMYLNGDSVPRDLVEAHAWASQAVYNEAEDAEDLQSRIERRLDADQLTQARRLFARWQIE